MDTKRSKTDWSHLRSVSDAQIDAVLGDDPDALVLAENKPAGGPRYVITRTRTGQFRWRLEGRDGQVIARSSVGFSRRVDCLRAAEESRIVALQASAPA